jgi:hypothetical protein
MIRFKDFEDSKNIKNKYSDLLNNKKVVIVGPASYLIGMNQGCVIDSYDIIVRINKGYNISKEMEKDIGSRTDVLYSSMLDADKCGINMPFEELKDKIQWLCAAYPVEKHKKNIVKVKKKWGKLNNFHVFDRNIFERCREKMKFPNAGTVAIIDLLRYNIKKLFVIGFTFYQISDNKGMYYYPGYHKYSNKMPTKTSKHSPYDQFKYVKEEIYKKNNKFFCDDVLEELFNK